MTHNRLIMVRLLIILFPCLILISGVQKNKVQSLKNPFDNLRYDKVVAYDYNGYAGREIVKDGKLIEYIYKQKELTGKQVKNFNWITGDTTSYGGKTAACFEPHLGVVYYQKEKIVGYISICLACNYLKSSIEIPASRYRKFISDYDSTYLETGYGFTREGSHQLSDFCESLGFDHCIPLGEPNLYNDLWKKRW